MRCCGVPFVFGLALALCAVGAEPARAAQCPSVMLVLDASGSMLQDPSGHWPEDPLFKGPSKWELLRTCMGEVVDKLKDRMAMGLMIYSGGGADDVTCASDCSVQVPVSHTSSAAIVALLGKTTPAREAQTPTNGAIRVARLDPGLRVAGIQQSIILVTDGDPNCGSDRKYADIDTHVINSDVSQYPGTVLGELDQAFRQSPSIRTYVVGYVGEGVSPQNLENMGYYGGDRRPGCGSNGVHCYYPLEVGGPSCGEVFNMVTSQLEGEFMKECQNTCEGGACPPGEVCLSAEIEPTPHCAPVAGDGGATTKGDAGCQCRIGGPRSGATRIALLAAALVIGGLLRPRRRRNRSYRA